jgi:hypothetical protein
MKGSEKEEAEDAHIYIALDKHLMDTAQPTTPQTPEPVTPP